MMKTTPDVTFRGWVCGRTLDGVITPKIHTCMKGDLAIIKRLNDTVAQFPDAAKFSTYDGFSKKIIVEVDKTSLNKNLRLPWFEALYVQLSGEQKKFLEKSNLDNLKTLIFEIDSQEIESHKRLAIFPAAFSKIKKFEETVKQHLCNRDKDWFVKYFY